jgi:monoterpene epsilon-lactone hydrolase
MRPRSLPRNLVLANVAAFYRVAFDPRVPLNVQRRMLDVAARSQPLPAGTVIRQVSLGSRPAERITVGATERPRAVLYLHGGGYTACSPATHRSLGAFIARESGSVVYTLDYRLAPEHLYPAALDDAVEAFLDLDQPRVAIAGDSAGGGLAVAAACRLIDRGVTPRALALLSPWTDPGDEAMPRLRDIVVNVGLGRSNAAAYLGTGDRRDPGFAPMYADLSGLPPTLVHVVPNELLYGQVQRFVARMRDAGVDFTLRELPRLWHSAHAQAGLLREARDAVHDVGAFLRANLDATARPPREGASVPS